MTHGATLPVVHTHLRAHAERKALLVIRCAAYIVRYGVDGKKEQMVPDEEDAELPVLGTRRVRPPAPSATQADSRLGKKVT